MTNSNISTIRCTANADSITEDDVLDVVVELVDDADGTILDAAMVCEMLGLPPQHPAVTRRVMAEINLYQR